MEVPCLQSPGVGATPAVPQSSGGCGWRLSSQFAFKVLTEACKGCTESVSLTKTRKFPGIVGTQDINVLASPQVPGLFSPLLQNQCTILKLNLSVPLIIPCSQSNLLEGGPVRKRDQNIFKEKSIT